MHELSIAHAVVEAATAAARDEGSPRASVTVVRLQIGALSGVVRSALTFAFDVAAEGTPVEGARLEIEEIPAVVFCPVCSVEVALTSPQRFRCPTCDAPTPQLVRGRELELTSIELSLPAAADDRAGVPA